MEVVGFLTVVGFGVVVVVVPGVVVTVEVAAGALMMMELDVLAAMVPSASLVAESMRLVDAWRVPSANTAMSGVEVVALI